MSQLINIRITQGMIDIHSTRGHFEKTGPYGARQPKLEIRHDKGRGLSMERTPSRMESNMDEVLDSVKPFKMKTILKERAEEAHRKGSDAAVKYASFGWDAMASEADIAKLSSSDFIYKDANKNFGLDFTPKKQLDISYVPSKLKIDHDKDRIEIDVKRGENPYEFVRGGVEVSLKRKPDVTIEYIGGRNFFPTGHAPKGAHIDKRV